MNCKQCDTGKMELISVGANCTQTHAFNLYQCTKCDSICKSDVRKDAGEIWISSTNEVTRWSAGEQNQVTFITEITG